MTAQYFLWYFALLPLVAPLLHLTKREIFYGSLLWGFAQVKGIFVKVRCLLTAQVAEMVC